MTDRTGTIVVRGLPPIWGTPSPSPFVIKVLAWLRMAGIEHELRPLRSPPRSSTKKIPYIELPSGEVVSDSGRIIARLSRERGVDLDAGLDEAARAQGHVIGCMLESHLYFAALYERFATPEGFACVRRDYFAHMPWLVRAILPGVIRRAALRNLHGQGTLRLAREEVAEMARSDVRALAAMLGDRPYFLGAQPRTIDATALGFLWAISSHPFESASRAAFESHPTLVSYVARMRSAYWDEPKQGARVGA